MHASAISSKGSRTVVKNGFVKSAVAGRLLPKEVIDLSGIDGLDYAVCKRIRLIPVTRGDTTHVLTGFLADEVLIGERGEGICATLAIDKEEGTYGGYLALVPSGVLNDALYK